MVELVRARVTGGVLALLNVRGSQKRRAVGLTVGAVLGLYLLTPLVALSAMGAERFPRSPRIASMATPERIYRASVRVFSLVFIAFGLAILATTLVNGGGPLSLGVVMGVVFMAVGAGRLWAAARMSR